MWVKDGKGYPRPFAASSVPAIDPTLMQSKVTRLPIPRIYSRVKIEVVDADGEGWFGAQTDEFINFLLEPLDVGDRTSLDQCLGFFLLKVLRAARRTASSYSAG
jgi:hypothetical protein